MSDLRDQLQAALGSAYTVDRELGGGGMSRVFVARDNALRRDVAIKVLPPELVAGVNVERFRREILVAAGLQHPHIVPVLASGEMDGLPWFSMPFVQGASLRERATRGPLPMGEAISTLREIAKALSYAHERGVVHRDIKPDNVLITGGTAVVTDFGIAKALSASRTDGDAHGTRGGLTQVGTSIGTPAYMAPEQAAADPNTDARADLYSFGCVAYELLTGHPPFAGLSPQKLLAAHMSDRPQDVTLLRRDTLPLLGQLVMRCLEKDPANRPPSAADVVRALDLLSVTSGDAVAAPAILVGRRVSLPAALGVWVAVFAATWILAKAAIVGIGLPAWVLPGAVVIAGLGLPAVIFTAFVQRTARAELARTPTLTPGGTPSPSSTLATMAMKASRHVSWRRTVRGGLIAFAAFAAFVAAVMILRAFGVGPAASLLAAGRMSQRELLLVSDFAVTKGDSTLGGVVSEAIRASLSQSSTVSLMPASSVTSALQRMQKAPGSRLDLALAREVAQREGAKAIVDGDLVSLGGGYAITVRLVTADSGTVLARVQQVASSPQDLISAADKAGRALRERMGESLRSVQNAPALEQVTTPSLEALRLYSEGNRAYDALGDLLGAIDKLRAAVRIDTGFAMAWRKLGVAQLTSGAFPRSVVDSSFREAYLHRDRLTTRERNLTIGSYFSDGPGHDRARAADAYQQLLTAGDSDVALVNYGIILLSRRRFVEAETAFAAATHFHATSRTSLTDLAITRADAGDTAGARRALSQLAGQGDSPTVVGAARTLEIQLDEVVGNLDRAVRLADSLVAHGDPFTRGQAMILAPTLSVIRGRPSEAASKLAAFNAFASSMGLPADPMMGAEFFATTNIALDRPDLAAAQLDSQLTRTPFKALAESDRDYLGVAGLLARAGRPDRARAILAERSAESRDTARLRAEAPLQSRVLGYIAVAEGRPKDAIKEFWKGDSLPDGPYDECDLCTYVKVARAYDKASLPDSAIKYYELTTKSTWAYRLNEDVFRAPIERRLGELYEARGDRDRAVAHYQAFVELWKDAEPSLQPQVADVRKRLARLSDTERR